MQTTETTQSTLEIFNDFAKKTNRKIYSSIGTQSGNFIYGVTSHKRILIIPNNDREQCFLIGYQDPKNLSENELFFGVFFPLNIAREKTLKIRERCIIDKINPFGNKDVLKTGNSSFDALTVITGSDVNMANDYFTSRSAQQIVLDSINMKEGFLVGINDLNLDFADAFKNKSHFGIYTKLRWIVDEKIIEDLFSKAEQFRALINGEY